MDSWHHHPLLVAAGGFTAKTALDNNAALIRIESGSATHDDTKAVIEKMDELLIRIAPVKDPVLQKSGNLSPSPADGSWYGAQFGNPKLAADAILTTTPGDKALWVYTEDPAVAKVWRASPPQ